MSLPHYSYLIVFIAISYIAEISVEPYSCCAWVLGILDPGSTLGIESPFILLPGNWHVIFEVSSSDRKW